MKVLVDTTIWSVALRNTTAVFTTDKDFTNYSEHLDLELHKPRKS